jgi:hypothetical protein
MDAALGFAHRDLPLRKTRGDADDHDARGRVDVFEGDVVHAEAAFARQQELGGQGGGRGDGRQVEVADGVGVGRKQQRGHGRPRAGRRHPGVPPGARTGAGMQSA